MKHARSDYDMIQDPRGKIPAAEPVFLLRGQDPKAQACLKLWCDLAAKDGSDHELIEMTRKHILAMNEWQLKIAQKKSDLPPKVDTTKPQDVKKGQIWESVDFRSRGLEVLVTHIQGIDALCEVVAEVGGASVKNRHRQVRIPLARFKPNAPMGYVLKADVESTKQE